MWYFDKVPHKRLLHILHVYGIGGKTLPWIEDMLNCHTQRVVLIPALSGMLQGSVLE